MKIKSMIKSLFGSKEEPVEAKPESKEKNEGEGEESKEQESASNNNAFDWRKYQMGQPYCSSSEIKITTVTINGKDSTKGSKTVNGQSRELTEDEKQKVEGVFKQAENVFDEVGEGMGKMNDMLEKMEKIMNKI